jgi:hypothetical protein
LHRSTRMTVPQLDKVKLIAVDAAIVVTVEYRAYY